MILAARRGWFSGIAAKYAVRKYLSRAWLSPPRSRQNSRITRGAWLRVVAFLSQCGRSFRSFAVSCTRVAASRAPWRAEWSNEFTDDRARLRVLHEQLVLRRWLSLVHEVSTSFDVNVNAKSSSFALASLTSECCSGSCRLQQDPSGGACSLHREASTPRG